MSGTPPFDPLRAQDKRKLAKLTSDKLDKWCKDRGLSTSGTDEEKIERLVEWKATMSSQGGGGGEADAKIDTPNWELKGYRKLRLQKLSELELSVLCEERGLETSGTKDQLVERLLEFKKALTPAPAPAPAPPEAGVEGGGGADAGAEVEAVQETQDIEREEVVIISHNVKKFTRGTESEGKSVADLEERLTERVANLKRCYEVEGPSASADVLVIQEVMSTDGGRDAAQKLTTALIPRGRRPSRDYRLLLSDHLGDDEAAAVI
jgi:hypothetical protein